MDYLLLKGGLVYETGKEKLEKKDILIQGDKIISLQPTLNKKKITVLDVSNTIITPGFIEINSEILSSKSIFQNPVGDFYFKRGITSVVFGSDGISLAPLFFGSRHFLNDITSIDSKINLGWNSFGEMMRFLEKTSTGINFGFYLGYATLRNIFSFQREGDLTLGEIESLSRIIKENLKEGALGIAFDLSQPYLSSLHPEEINKIINFSLLKHKVVSFHLENSYEPLLAWKKLFNCFHHHSLNIEIGHLQPNEEKENEFLEIVRNLDEISNQQNIHFDIFPEPLTKVSIVNLLPKWAVNQNIKSLLLMKENSSFYERILESLNYPFLENAFITDLPKPLNFFNGKLLKEVAMNQNVSPQQMLIKIAILSKMRGSLIVHQVKEETLNILMNHQKSILSLDYYFFYEDNALIFKKILSSSKFIQKLTSLPAKKFNLQKRGEIQEGYYADLVVFKDYRPYYVFVNGKLVLNAGKIENNLPGKPLETKFEI